MTYNVTIFMFFFIATKSDEEIIEKPEAELVESYVVKVTGIRDVLKRDHMKVAFFGRYCLY